MMMNPDWLLKHFNEITEAPDAVPRLRRFILDLAVRGKLVEQDPNDEPASELLKRIEAESSRLIKSGEIRNQRVFQPVKRAEMPFELPKHWEWVRLLSLGITKTGNTPSKDNPEYFGDYIPFVKPADLTGTEINYNGEGISREGLPYARLIPAGSVLMVCIGSSIGKVNRTTRDICCNQQINTITPFVADCEGFLALSLKADFFGKLLLGQAGTGTLPIISKGKWEKLPVPLPPLAEQHRIVAKVDELMGLCDEMEAAQQKRERRRDRLVAATLNGLTNGKASLEPGRQPDFGESARFYFNHLPRLTARPEHIQQLRQTILNLAVRGKLVPQDPHDEPTDSLISCIEAERKHRGSAGEPVNTQALAYSGDGGFPIPQFWRWGRLGFVTNVLMGQSPPGETYNTHGEGIPLINGPVEFSEGPFGVTVLNQYTTAPTKLCKKGDLLLCVRGSTTGRTNIAGFDACIGRGVAALQPFYNDQYVRLFVWLWRDKIIEMGRGIAFPSISRQQIEDLPIPLPPLAEQYRIVAKVDELMVICDELESRLNTTATTRRQLLEATLQEALKGGI